MGSRIRSAKAASRAHTHTIHRCMPTKSCRARSALTCTQRSREERTNESGEQEGTRARARAREKESAYACACVRHRARRVRSAIRRSLVASCVKESQPTRRRGATSLRFSRGKTAAIRSVSSRLRRLKAARGTAGAWVTRDRDEECRGREAWHDRARGRDAERERETDRAAAVSATRIRVLCMRARVAFTYTRKEESKTERAKERKAFATRRDGLLLPVYPFISLSLSLSLYIYIYIYLSRGDVSARFSPRANLKWAKDSLAALRILSLPAQTNGKSFVAQPVLPSTSSSPSRTLCARCGHSMFPPPATFSRRGPSWASPPPRRRRRRARMFTRRFLFFFPSPRGGDRRRVGERREGRGEREKNEDGRREGEEG